MIESAKDGPISPGTILGKKYRVDAIVGEGGMGAVYAVTHLELGRRAAIKTLLPKFLKDENVARRFRQEAQLAASIGHDNICEVVDIATTEDGLTYLVMPLLHGQTLGELLDQRHPSLETIVDIICQTLSALAAAHNAHIVHRDLKPQNIFVTRVGDRENFVKLLDFGISKILDQDEVTQLTQTGAMLGTPFYMSPEQVRGDKDIDERVDIYALGNILYEAFTGVCPYQGDSYNNVIYKILCGEFTPIRDLNPAVPLEIEQVVLQAMAFNREDRYRSTDEMREALMKALAHAQMGARTPSDHAPGPAPVDDNSPDAGGQMRQPISRADTVQAEASSDSALGVPSKKTPFDSVVTINAPPPGRRIALAVLALALLVASVLSYVFIRMQAEPPTPIPVANQPVTEPQELPVATGETDSDSDTEGVAADTAREPPKAKQKKSRAARKSTRKRRERSSKDGEKAVKGRFGTTFTPDY